MRAKSQLSRGLFLLGIAWLLAPQPADALIAAHLNYDGCFTCHKLHGSPSQSGSLLSELSPEATCLSCHGPLGIATEVAVHGSVGQVTCLGCHNPHNNDRLNVLGGNNILLVGMAYDVNDTNDPRTPLATPQVREETPAAEPGQTILGPLKEVVFQVSPDDWTRPDGFGICNACHTSIHNEGEDCAACHAHSGGFAGVGCTGCHDGSGAGALAVSSGSPHSETATGYTCEQCHVGHGAGTIEIPNYATVGINYGSNGEAGISLGSATVAGATEAEICWNCHDTIDTDAGTPGIQPVSEWGTNTRAVTGNSPYNYGSLNQVNWVGATWSSPNFSYKTGTIQSTHSVNPGDPDYPAATGPGVDAVGAIRCSYCHDVHDTMPGSPNGKPYLRGTWKGNPYKEDGAPLVTSTYTPRHWGAVPRGSTLNNEYGGYQIDQNNGYPTAGGVAPTWNAATNTWTWTGLWTLNDSAGLCVLCHGSNVDGMDQFTSAATDWVGGVNGHSNAVIEGTGSGGANIFRTSWRAPSGVDTQGAKPDMGYRNHGTGVGYGFRGTDGRAFDILNPTMDGQLAAMASRPYGGSFYQWGAQVNDGTLEKKYHQFSCSKCHNPHASRLPRLMMTNCLDTRHNTWDDPRAGINAVDQARSNNNGITLSSSSTPDNWGRTWSNTTSAQNCHRLAGDNRGTPVPGFGLGWNTVTPW